MKLGQKIQRIIGSAHTYEEKDEKRALAHYYLREARESLLIYKMLDSKGDFVSMSFEAKKIINLLYPFECSLKSLVISLSKKEESIEALNAILEKDNDLDSLYSECISRSKDRTQLISPSFVPMLAEIDKFGGNIIYNKNIRTIYEKIAREEWFIDGPLSALDSNLKRKLLTETIGLYRRAERLYGVNFACHEATGRRLQAFLATLA